MLIHPIKVVIARTVFTDLSIARLWILWLSLDVIADLIYLVDMFVRARTGFLEQGLLICDVKKTRRLYVRSRQFMSDFVYLIVKTVTYS